MSNQHNRRTQMTADRPATETRTEAYPPYPFSRPTPTAAPKAAEHDADPGPFDHDDLDWGLRCVKCDELITPDERRWRHG